MDWFKTVKSYYDLKFYDKAQVAVFVVKGKITPAQYEEITGDVYTP